MYNAVKLLCQSENRGYSNDDPASEIVRAGRVLVNETEEYDDVVDTAVSLVTGQSVAKLVDVEVEAADETTEMEDVGGVVADEGGTVVAVDVDFALDTATYPPTRIMIIMITMIAIIAFLATPLF